MASLPLAQEPLGPELQRPSASAATGQVDVFEDVLGPVTQDVIRENAPLATDLFPPTSKFPTDHLHSIGSQNGGLKPTRLKPVMLTSREQLAEVMAQSSLRDGFSNFTEASSPANSAIQPLLPTLTRFVSLRIGNGIDLPGKLEADTASWSTDNVEYSLSFPVHLSVTDGRRFPLPGMGSTGISDCPGYPLFFDSSRPLYNVGVRSSGALFRSNVSRSLTLRIGAVPDVHSIRSWAHMFNLSGDTEATAILLQRVKSVSSGDNHIALLVKAYLHYLDSIAAELEGVSMCRNDVSARGIVIDTSKQTAWVGSTLESGKEIVNVLGGPPAYQEFWAYCCFEKPPVYAGKLTDGKISTTPFSHYEMSPLTCTICVCDSQPFSTTRQPAFYGKPDVILGHIEAYVHRYSLQRQANEALQIAMLWPTLSLLKAHISLPRPLHTADWMGGEVERASDETSYSSLLMFGPLVNLASTLAAAWAVQSQIHDYIALITSQRTSWRLSSQALRFAGAWLGQRVSAPGTGWEFLLRSHFDVSSSFLYLTGLSSAVMDWPSFFASRQWSDASFPAHLRLLQPYWVKTSVACILPWETTWRPSLEINGPFLTAEPSTIMRLVQLQVISIQNAESLDGQYTSQHLTHQEGDDTVEYDVRLLDRLRTAHEHGLRVLAIPGPWPSSPTG